MWLPEPIYKSLPTLYAAMGVLFIVGVLYVGLYAPMGPVYLGAGVVSLLAAVAVSYFRRKRSGNPEDTDSDDAPTS